MCPLLLSAIDLQTYLCEFLRRKKYSKWEPFLNSCCYMRENFDILWSKTIILYFSQLRNSQVFLLDDCIISNDCMFPYVCVCVSIWHCQSQSAGAITSHSHHLQYKDTLRTNRIKSVCQRECVGETTLISAFQPVLPGIFAMFPHQTNATVIYFVRLYSKKTKDIWMYCHCLPAGSI